MLQETFSFCARKKGKSIAKSQVTAFAAGFPAPESRRYRGDACQSDLLHNFCIPPPASIIACWKRQGKCFAIGAN